MQERELQCGRSKRDLTPAKPLQSSCAREMGECRIRALVLEVAMRCVSVNIHIPSLAARVVELPTATVVSEVSLRLNEKRGSAE